MTRLVVVAGLALWVGATLLLAEVRWFARRPLAARLRPHVAGGPGRAGGSEPFSVASLREAVGPLAREVGERLAGAVGVDEDLATRLARVHSPLDPTDFRLRQVGWAVAAFGLGTLVVLAAGPPPVLAALLLLAGPLLAFLVLEQQLATASQRWQRRLRLELPVVAEQLGMLLGAGYSLTAALERVASRGHGAAARDLSRVTARVRQGLPEERALAEWAGLARVDAVERLVAVLALDRETTDLGRLIADEARAIRRGVHRELTETMERRSQQVWIPVTVATLVPGVVFVSIPFIEALRVFTS